MTFALGCQFHIFFCLTESVRLMPVYHSVLNGSSRGLLCDCTICTTSPINRLQHQPGPGLTWAHWRHGARGRGGGRGGDRGTPSAASLNSLSDGFDWGGCHELGGLKLGLRIIITMVSTIGSLICLISLCVSIRASISTDCALSHLGLGQLGRLAPVVVGGDAVEGGVLARGEAAQLPAVAAVADLEAAGAEDLAALPPLLLLLLGPAQRGELPLVGPGGGGGGGLGGAPVGGVAAAGASRRGCCRWSRMWRPRRHRKF